MNNKRIGWVKAVAAFLKQLFPAAVAFSPLAGEPLHFTAYAANPRVNPAARAIGFAFCTMDLAPLEHGYHGPKATEFAMRPSLRLDASVYDV